MRRRRERWGRRCRRWGEARPRRSPHRRPRRRPSPVRGGRLCRSVGQHRPAPDPAGRPAPAPSCHPAHAAVSSASTASPDLLVLGDAPPAAGPAQPFVRVRGTPRGSPATGPLRVRCRTAGSMTGGHVPSLRPRTDEVIRLGLGRGLALASRRPRPWRRPGLGVMPSSASDAARPRRRTALGLRSRLADRRLRAPVQGRRPRPIRRSSAPPLPPPCARPHRHPPASRCPAGFPVPPLDASGPYL